ncbi:MFS transporter [Lysinibacter cavernae]|uniref:MFS family permease n=1 Tax=Lysinibacter cavernae TaxID=1640652 RepID=A0A7X5R014_9MICO|nr:MFS transporter [Lysinibacter cavernae]NIH53116.1 MFS family permease [Lysinibacter cavernae]
MRNTRPSFASRAQSGSWRPWLVWGSAILCYIIAVFSRTSLSATGINAAERFGIDSTTLSSFAVLQLVVYAAMQVPVGILVDRFGARALIISGAVLMTAGQFILALATETGTAILARGLVGAGDAMTFISVIRLIPAWFPSRRIPILTQATGMLGQFGQILSIIPLVAALNAFGWTTAYLGLTAVLALSILLAVVAVYNSPIGSAPTGPVASFRAALRGIPESWRHPATRLGFWTHFVTPFAGSTFTLLWGYPFMMAGEGLSQSTAASMYVLLIGASLVFSMLTARVVSRHPMRRSYVVLGIVSIQVVVWTTLMFWPTQAPLWLMCTLMLTFAIGGPGSLIGFDFAQQFTPAHRLGSASGLINSAGFIATIIALFLFGLALDLQGAGTPDLYSRDAFRHAMLVYYPIWIIGVLGVLLSRKQLRRWIANRHSS